MKRHVLLLVLSAALAGSVVAQPSVYYLFKHKVTGKTICEPDAPDAAYEKAETRARVRAAIAALPPREQKVISLYYYREATMKEIGSEIGVNESRVSQLHARAIRRLREALGEMGPAQMAEVRQALVAFTRKPVMAKADTTPAAHGVVLAYKPADKRPQPVRAAIKVAPRQRTAVAVAR